MGCGRWTTHRAARHGTRLIGRLAAAVLACGALLPRAGAQPGSTAATQACAHPVYLTFDTGHMGVAPLVADVLRRQQVRVTFFVANERTVDGASSLGDGWAAWWRERAAEGHVFGSHTWDHGYWQADLRPAGDGTAGTPSARFRIRQTFGAQAGQAVEWNAAQYCDELRRPLRRLREWGVGPLLPLFRAPGGRTSPALLRAARACGFEHVPWSSAGFLGDELPSDRYPNGQLLRRALRDVREGDILLAHLGIWSRKDAWAPAVLEPLIVGLKQRGLCFATLDHHPAYRDWIARAPRP